MEHFREVCEYIVMALIGLGTLAITGNLMLQKMGIKISRTNGGDSRPKTCHAHAQLVSDIQDLRSDMAKTDEMLFSKLDKMADKMSDKMEAIARSVGQLEGHSG